MAALQYPIVIADMPIRWDEPAWLPDPSPVFEDTANSNYNMIRDIESHSVLLQQLNPTVPGTNRPTASGDDDDDDTDDVSVTDSDRPDDSVPARPPAI